MNEPVNDKNPAVAPSVLSAGLGVTLRRTALWLSGRDLFAPALPKLSAGVWRVSGPPDPLWVMTLSKDEYIKFMLPDAPNVIHRLAQRVVLGFRWRMLPKPPNVKLRGDQQRIKNDE